MAEKRGVKLFFDTQKTGFEKNAKKFVIFGFFSIFCDFFWVFLYIRCEFSVLKVCSTDRGHLNLYTDHKKWKTKNVKILSRERGGPLNDSSTSFNNMNWFQVVFNYLYEINRYFSNFINNWTALCLDFI